ncbi:MAG: YigZ family protein [Cyclobacteriaceae bacterium]
MDKFQTIQGPAEGLYKEKGSKFLAFAYPVSDTETIRQTLEEVKKKYHDARHHCHAYILGMQDQAFKANDDGEPNHSAGDPILGQIRAFGLTNVLVVVVRYFGGIKLGVGGLVTAYKTAAEDALMQAKTMEIYPTESFSLQFPYELTGEMESLFNDFQIHFKEKSFTENCQFSGEIRAIDQNAFKQRLEKIYGVEFTFVES